MVGLWRLGGNLCCIGKCCALILTKSRKWANEKLIEIDFSTLFFDQKIEFSFKYANSKPKVTRHKFDSAIKELNVH